MKTKIRKQLSCRKLKKFGFFFVLRKIKGDSKVFCTDNGETRMKKRKNYKEIKQRLQNSIDS